MKHWLVPSGSRWAVLLTLMLFISGAPLFSQVRPQVTGEGSSVNAARTDTPAVTGALDETSRTDGQERAAPSEHLPAPFWLALLTMVLGGAVGAFAADSLADGRIDAPIRDSRGWVLGVVGNLVIGAVAAVITLGLNPTSEWWRVVATAVAAGVGGQAILLSGLAYNQAKRAESKLEDASKLHGHQLETFRELSLRAHYRDGTGAEAADGLGKVSGTGEAVFEEIINTYASRARAEFTAAIG